jgi:hypothetical protein
MRKNIVESSSSTLSMKELIKSRFGDL